jgi:prolyl oligopeptidase
MPKLAYPAARRDDVVDVLHGLPVRDPYRWLEANTPEVLAWQIEQTALCQSVLDQWPDRDRLRQAIRAALLAGASQAGDLPVFQGPFAFHAGSMPGAQQSVLWVSEGDDEQRVLVDPNALEAGSALDWYFPSPNGEFVAYGISRHGDEQSVLHVIETRTGRVLPERIPHTSFCRVAWLPDSSGFYHSGNQASDLEDAEKWLFFHRLGDQAASAPEPVRFNKPHLIPRLSSDGRHLMVIAGWEDMRVAYYLDRQGEAGWQLAMLNKDGESAGQFVGDRFLALTSYGASRGRIVAFPPHGAADESTWTEILPESKAVLRHFVEVDGRLVISEMHEAISRVRVVYLDGQEEKIIPLPEMGLMRGAGDLTNTPFSVQGHTVYFVYSTFTEPKRLYALDLDSLELKPLGAEPAAELSHLQVRQIPYSSQDGTRTSMFLVHRKDLDLSKPNPALLHGYGGWNVVPVPGYVGGTLGGGAVRCVLPFLEAGGIYAFANLRGDATFGRAWWHGGRCLTKQNTFDDFYAAAEHLIASGLTTADELAAFGASNGGLLAGASVTQRPDLFKAVVAEVPVVDMVREVIDPYLKPYAIEYGDPDDPDMLRALLGYSPVHNVREGERYPATLIVSGTSDIRCPPWHGRKLAALLQHATASDAPILLNVGYGGHGLGLPLDASIERHALVVGFVMQQLGMFVAGQRMP